MKNVNWIRTGILAVAVCTAVGAAHAQSNMLRRNAPVNATKSLNRAQKPILVADAIWNYVTGIMREGFVKAIKGPDPTDTVAVNDRFFDRADVSVN